MNKILSFIVLFTMLISVNLFAEEVVKVFSVEGDVKVVPKGKNIGIRVEEDMLLHSGDWIKTGGSSRIEISFDSEEQNIVKIEENSLVIIKLDGYFKVQLLKGDIYAILENIDSEESFRVLTPSVVTESMSSGWGASTDGTYTNVMVYDNKVLIAGINDDGSVKEEKYWIDKGQKRKTINFQDPGELEQVSDEMLEWFKEQVIALHMEKFLNQQNSSKEASDNKTSSVNITDDGGAVSNETLKNSLNGGRENKFIVDGKKVSILDFLYQSRLGKK